MGYAFIGDIHSQHEILGVALDYCYNNELTPILLGDVFDTHHRCGNAYQTYSLLREAQEDLGAIILRSNHHNKLERHLEGKVVRMSTNFVRTLKDFEEAGFDIANLKEWLLSFPYALVLTDYRGQEYRVAHAFFPSSLKVDHRNTLTKIFEVPRKVKDQLLYGPVVKDKNGKRCRLEWWKEPRNRGWKRVAGHYHVLHEDTHSLVLDGCLGGSELYTSDPRDELLALYDVDDQRLLTFGRV